MSKMITLEQRKKLLRQQPNFSGMSEVRLSDIANLMEEKEFAENEIIVKEGDVIDSFYIIAQGHVAVSHLIKSGDESQPAVESVNLKVIATLGVGEAIGLSDKGFFSKTGARVATVTSLIKTILLEVNLEDFLSILKEHPSLLPHMQAATTTMLRMNFIKQLLPFSKISMDDLKWLAEQVIEIQVFAGEILFREGDYGESAYLIEKGVIEILAHSEDNDQESVIATLEAPNLFGEAAVLLNTVRNATARVRENSTLLVINRIDFEKLNERKATSSKGLATMVIERSRPTRLPGITVNKSEAGDKELVVTLCNTVTNKYYRLMESGWFVWQQLDGLKSMRDITLLFLKKYDQFTPRVLTALILDLAQQGFIEIKGMHIPSEGESLTFWVKLGAKITRIMEAKYTFLNVDEFFQKIHVKVSFLFKPVSVYIGICIILSGIIIFGYTASHVVYELHHYPLHKIALMIIAMNFITLPFVFIHECGHGLTTKHFGRKVNGLGFGWYWLGPIAFCDTSDMWLGTQRQRLLVNSAGLYIDAVRAGIFVWIVLFSHIPGVQLFFWLYALSVFSMIYANFNPVIELDGYYLLSDLLNETDLRENAVVWLTDDFPKILRQPKQVISGHKNEMIFWLVCVIHILLGMIIAWATQYYIASIVWPDLARSHWSWILPAIVIVAALLSVRSQIRQAKENKESTGEDFTARFKL